MSRYVVQSGWEDAPHLSPEARSALEGAYPLNERAARTRGIPSLGAGAIYPIPEDEFTVDPFPLPVHYKHAYALDVGWNRTAALFGALDPDTDIVYFYHEYYRSQAEPPIHAVGIKAVAGDWMPGVIDPAARGRAQNDGSQLFSSYVALGLRLSIADNSVETGIYDVWTGISTRKLRVFKTLENWLMEFRLYRRDDKGKIVKENDHLMDCTRYFERSARPLAAWKPRNEWPQARKQSRQAIAEYDPFSEDRMRVS